MAYLASQYNHPQGDPVSNSCESNRRRAIEDKRAQRLGVGYSSSILNQKYFNAYGLQDHRATISPVQV